MKHHSLVIILFCSTLVQAQLSPPPHGDVQENFRPNSLLLEAGTIGVYRQAGLEYQYFYQPDRLLNGRQFYVSGQFQYGETIPIGDVETIRRYGAQWGGASR